MKARLALALLSGIVTVVPATGGADREMPGLEQSSRQPFGPGRVPPGFPAPPSTAPHRAYVPNVRPSPYGSPGSFLPLPLPYQRPPVNWTRVLRHVLQDCEVEHVERAHPYNAIIDIAKAKGCDLIVMASHGRRGVSAIVLGSETLKVLTHSTIPVLVYCAASASS